MIGKILLTSEEEEVVIRIMFCSFCVPIGEVTRIVRQSAIPGNHDRLFNLLFLAVFVRNGLINLFLMKIISKLTIYVRSKTIYYSASIILEAAIDRRISRSQGDIALAENVVTSQNARGRQCTDRYGGSI